MFTNQKVQKYCHLTMLLAAEAIISQLGQNQSKSVIAVDGGHSCRIWAP
jgi:phage gp45-like